MTREDRLRAAVRSALAELPDGAIGVAVSGGGDSTALACLLADWAAGAGRRVEAVTIDHRLRPVSAAEAAAAARLCAGLGVRHAVRAWEEGPGGGNLQGSARAARQRLIAAFDIGLTSPDWALGFRWDIILRGRDRTPMET